MQLQNKNSDLKSAPVNNNNSKHKSEVQIS